MAGPLDRAFVEILPDFSKFSRELQSNVRDATRTLESRLEGALNNLERKFQRFGGDAGDEISDGMQEAARETERAADDVVESINDIDDAADRADTRVNVPVDVDREGTFSKFLASITGVRLPIGGFLVLGSAAAAAAGAVVQLGAALAPAVGAIAGLPAVAGVAAAAIGTLQLATQGVGEAFGAAFEDAETFNEAIEGLAPSAQESARAFRELAPAMEELQQSVQQQFFEGMADEITAAGDALLGPMQEGASVAAASMGTLVQGLLQVAASDAGVDFVTSSFEVLNEVINNIAEPVEDLFTAFLNLGTAINEAFGGEEAGAGLASMIQNFADFIQAATESGEAVQWVEDAFTVFQQIGAIIAPIIDIFGSIGEAADASGGNILGVFGEALQVFADFLNTADGMATLTTLFETFNTIGGAFADIIAGIGPALPPIISGISNLVNAVVPLIAPLAEVTGEILAALAPVLTVVANAIEPLIPPIVELAEMVGEVLISALDAVMPIIETLAGIMSDNLAVVLDIVIIALEALMPVIEALLTALQPLFEAMQPVFEIFAQVAGTLAELLVPVLEFLAEILLWVVETIIVPIVIPIIEFLAELFSTVLTGAVQFFADFFSGFAEGLVALFTWLKDKWDENALLLKVAWELVQNAFQTGWNFIRDNVINPIVDAVQGMGDTIGNILGGIRDGFDSVVGFLGSIPDRIGGALSGMWDGISNGFKSAINFVIDGWNNLSFTVPSVDMGPLGSFGGFTVSTPNIPRLQVGGMSMGTGLANLDPNEAILPLEDQRTTNLLASALERALVNVDVGSINESLGGGAGDDGGDIQVIVRIGERELTDIVDTEVKRNNRTLTRRARAGTGRTN